MKREIINIEIGDTVPSVEQILVAQGVPPNAVTNQSVISAAKEAIAMYSEFAEPIGIAMPISKAEFDGIYQGEGMNADATPLDGIATKAGTFCLFAVTVGASIADKISELFDCRDFALASMLDAAASEGTESTAQRIEDHYVEYLDANNMLGATMGVLRFSPGYCGWHVSAQRKLFRHLQPEDIAIRLTDSFLMLPLKSISGVIISGEKSIFEFEDSFPFCSECVDHSCVERLKSMMKS